MKCSASSVRKRTNSEYGSLSTSKVGRSSHSMSETAVVKVPKRFGSQYQSATGSMPRSIPMAGVPMRGSFPKSNIESSINNGASPITSSDSTVPSDSGSLVWSGSLSPFPRRAFSESSRSLKSHRSHQVFHLPLQSRKSMTCIALPKGFMALTHLTAMYRILRSPSRE